MTSYLRGKDDAKLYSPGKPEIIAENEWLIAVNKPAGLIVHSDGRTIEPSLAEWLIEKYPYLADVGEPWLSPQGERVRIAGTVHRLDRTTSGVILVAKTNEAFVYFKKEFKERRVGKKYLAYVYGEVAKEGRIVAEIMRSSERPKKWYARLCEESDSRAAITEWTLLNTHRDGDEVASFVEARPLTGRTHQIRVHFASIGHPVVADHLYAPDRQTLFGFNRPALHASSISVALPDGTRAEYLAPPPKDFQI